MGPLSEDSRKRVVSAVCEEGMSCRGSARRFGVSFSSAIRWVAALHERGSYAPLRMGGDTRSQRARRTRIFCLAFIGGARPYAPRNMRPSVACARREGVAIDDLAIFDRHDITFKIRARERAGPPGLLERRRRWFAGQLDLDPLKLVFVDQTAAATNMARRYGRRRRANVCATAFRMGITKRSPSSSACA